MERATHTVTDPPGKTPPAHRPPLPPVHWAVIDAWNAEQGLPPYPWPA